MPGGRAATGQIRRPQGSSRKATHTDRGKVISGKAACFWKTGRQKNRPASKQTAPPNRNPARSRERRISG
nr:MAG TPA: hypothetical protein [Caudoviricetes sp.]